MGEVVPTRSTAGRVFGRIAVGVAVLIAVAAVAAWLNPWHLVVVERLLFVQGVAMVAAVVFGCACAALPLPQFPPDRRAVVLVCIPLMSLQMWSMAVPGWPSDPPRELVRSPGGRHAVMLHRVSPDRPCLSIWSGHGLGARVAGTLGNAGDNPVVSFEARDRLVVWAEALFPEGSRRKVELRLDPVTGRPLDVLDRPC